MDSDQRHSRRLPPSAGRDTATLHHKGQVEGALIVNVSAEGLRICTFPDFQVEVGDVVRLETSDGHHTARVMNLDRSDGKLYVGLERVHDAPLSAPGQAVREALRRRRPGRPELSVGTILAYVILPLTIGLGLLYATVGLEGIRDLYNSIRRSLPN